ncbi:molybdate ABC transporter substrate-binding protein [Rhodococcus sovatensis]|uniref:molybdate ABC transporter substrate-binding protein n=1 Tax=Rhodococcus sovatensis TaxID=1805840 RepID=UPI003BAEB171
MTRTPISLLVLGAAVILLAGCGNSEGAGSATDTITVFAAASLKSTFTELGETFEAQNPAVTVEFNFAGSSDLVTALAQGAPADVFASADTINMTKAVEANLVDGEPVNFAKNTLTIVTAPGNPKDVASFADLADPDILTVVCAPQVPCGNATATLEKATGTTVPAVSEEASVTDVLGKVTSGQADAGLVYVTDAAGAGDQVTTVDFPEAREAVNTYPIAVLKSSRNVAAASAFEALLTGPTGRQVLIEAGFAAP